MASRNGHKSQPEKRVTLSDIAEQCNVSLTTVSLVLRNKPGVGIPTATRHRVLDTARELGYRSKVPMVIQPGLNQIGVVMKAREDDLPLANPFYSHVVAGIEAACRENRLNLLSGALSVDEENRPLEIPRFLEEKDVDGLLLVGAFVDDTLDHLLIEKHVPVVLVDGYSGSNIYDAVVIENFQGAYQAVSYLIERGHQHIAMVGSHSRAYPSIMERRRGYVEALREYQITTAYFADCLLRRDDAYAAASQLLHNHPQITAIFGANDNVAFGAIQAAQAMGRQVPQDLSAIGFDDIQMAHLFSPPLTTMCVDKVGLGRMAVQMLVQRVRMPDLPPLVTALRTHLTERQSVRDLR